MIITENDDVEDAQNCRMTLIQYASDTKVSQVDDKRQRLNGNNFFLFSLIGISTCNNFYVQEFLYSNYTSGRSSVSPRNQDVSNYCNFPS